MLDSTIAPLLLSSQTFLGGSDRQLRRRYERGELTRIRPGVYVESARWQQLSIDARYRQFVHGAGATLAKSTQFSHDSAVAAWHLPGIGPWPRLVHALEPIANGGRSSSGIRRHATGLDGDAVEINSLTVTSLARTVADFSRSTTFMRAVCATDAAMAPPEKRTFRHANRVPPLTLADFVRALSTVESSRGAARARRVAEFSTGLSGSPGESVSRVQFHLLGFLPPQLQVPFSDADGFIGYADFYWPELDLIGEFDGDVKYLDKVYRRGMLPEQVVLAEKRRENRLRRVVRALERWDWRVALDQRALVNRLRPHGLVLLH